MTRGDLDRQGGTWLEILVIGSGLLLVLFGLVLRVAAPLRRRPRRTREWRSARY